MVGGDGRFCHPTGTLIGGTPGPATLLVNGREVFTVDAAGNFTQVSETGEANVARPRSRAGDVHKRRDWA